MFGGVLQLQYVNKLRKWKPRNIRGQFLGWSKADAYTMVFSCNLKTRYIIPQLHTVMDDFLHP